MKMDSKIMLILIGIISMIMIGGWVYNGLSIGESLYNFFFIAGVWLGAIILGTAIIFLVLVFFKGLIKILNS